MVRYFVLCFSLFFVFASSQQDQELAQHFGLAKNAVDSSLAIRKYIMKTGAGGPEDAFNLLKQSKALLKNEKDEKIWADYYLNAGEIYLNYGEYDKAMEDLMKSYSYYKSDQPENSYNRQVIESDFIYIYMNTGHYDQAEIYMKRAYRYAVEKKDAYHLATSRVNLGKLYFQMFMASKDSSKLELSLAYFRKGYPWLEKHSEDPVNLQLNINFADALSNGGYNDSAQHYYQKAIKLLDNPKIDLSTKAWAYSQYARHFHDADFPDSAVFYAEKAFDLVKDGDQFTKLDVAKTLYKSYILKKDYEKATAFFEKYTELQDSLEQMEKYANIKTLIYQQQNPRRASWIEKNWIWLSVSVLTTFILIFIVVKINQKKKFSRAQIQLESLTAKITSLNSKIQGYETEIDELKNSDEKNLREIEEKEFRLKDILTNPILTDDQWLTFKQAFEKVNRYYSRKIPQNFSNISQAELRYLYLKKLGLTHKEMAAVLGISPDSLRSYKHRLRKKAKPGYEIDLFELQEELSE